MNVPSGPRKIVNPPKLIHRKLSLSVLAVMLVAGSFALALARPAEGKVVYTPTNVTISGNGSITLDLNHDEKTDFTVDAVASSGMCGLVGKYYLASVTVTPSTGNGVVAISQGAAALSSGAQIDSSQSFYGARALMASEALTFGPPPCRMQKIYLGYWCGGRPCHPVNAYLGLKFDIKGRTHYGWAHMIVTPSDFIFVAKLTGFAYETIPRKSIRAGQTKGADEADEEISPEASLANTIPDNPQVTTLGALPMGVPSLSIWQRRGRLGYGELSN
jgi:hypothetical protein